MLTAASDGEYAALQCESQQSNILKQYWSKQILIAVSVILLVIVGICSAVAIAFSEHGTDDSSQQPNPPNWPSSVYVLNASDLSSARDKFTEAQSNGQFSQRRYAFLLTPGDYSSLAINMSYYTSIVGLGATPSDVQLSNVMSRNDPPYGALNNFWRSIENVHITPTMRWNGQNDTMLWAVSQASPFRRVHVDGNLDLWEGDGYSSGGFIADSRVTGTIRSGSQQQFYLRNTNMSRWEGGAWNMVFQGTTTTCPICNL